MSSGKRAVVLWKVVELSEEFENERLKSREES